MLRLKRITSWHENLLTRFLMNAFTKILREHPLFSALSSRALNRLTAHASMVEFPKGSLVVKEGDSCDTLFVVLSGRCQSSMVLVDGSEQILEIFAPGDTFGERAVLARDRFWSTIKVITDSVLIRIDGEGVLRAMEKYSKFEKALEGRMHDQLRGMRKVQEPDKIGRIAAFASLSEAGSWRGSCAQRRHRHSKRDGSLRVVCSVRTR